MEAGLGFRLRHQNIVQLFGLTKFENDHLGIVMEWADQGTLAENMGEMSDEQRVKASLGICDGLAYLHSRCQALKIQ